MMKAVIWTRYGPPAGLQLQEVKIPSPEKHQILVRVKAASVTAGDCEMRRLDLPLMLSFPIRLYNGWWKPRRIPVLGQELAGVVEAVGDCVKNYQPGDAVFGTTGLSFGAYAEYLCLPEFPGDAEGVLAPKPQNLSFQEAAAAPTAGLEALHYLKPRWIQPGTRVLIIGGGGSIGTFAIQLARHYRAHVTAVDSAAKLELMRSLGADQVIDYQAEDYTRGKPTYDVIIDVVGRTGVTSRLKMLPPGGKYYLAYARPGDVLLKLWASFTGSRQLHIGASPQSPEDLQTLAGLLQSGTLLSVIDRTYPLDKAPEAHRYAESGQKKGHVAITVS